MTYIIWFYFIRRLSMWNFMHNSVINTFPKLTMFQELGPSPSDEEDLQVWSNPFGVLTVINYQSGIFWSPHFSELTKFENLGLASSD